MAQVQYVPDVGELSSVLGKGVLADPLSAVLVALGTLLLLFSIGLFGGLSLGGVVSPIVRAVREQSL